MAVDRGRGRITRDLERHIALGAFTPRVTDTAANALGARYVEEGFVSLLDSAAQHAARLGRRAVTPADVLESLAIHGFYENMPKPGYQTTGSATRQADEASLVHVVEQGQLLVVRSLEDLLVLRQQLLGDQRGAVAGVKPTDQLVERHRQVAQLDQGADRSPTSRISSRSARDQKPDSRTTFGPRPNRSCASLRNLRSRRSRNGSSNRSTPRSMSHSSGLRRNGWHLARQPFRQGRLAGAGKSAQQDHPGRAFCRHEEIVSTSGFMRHLAEHTLERHGRAALRVSAQGRTRRAHRSTTQLRPRTPVSVKSHLVREISPLFAATERVRRETPKSRCQVSSGH